MSYEGVLGVGKIVPEIMTTELRAALDSAECILVCLPTVAHVALAKALAGTEHDALPIILNPGHTGGILAFRQAYAAAGGQPPPIAEFSTLTYVARKPDNAAVNISGVARRVWVAALPGDESAIEIARALYPAATPAVDLIATGLSNVNMVLHPPGAILGASWVENTGGDFTFYVQGLSDGVGCVMEALDSERLAVAAAYGIELPTLFDEMQSIGTIEAIADSRAGLAAAVRGGTANSRIRAPDSLAHRYYREDFFFGVRPFLVLAGIARVEVPIASSLMRLAKAMVDPAGEIEGRSAKAMGIEGLNKRQLLAMVRN